MEHRKCWTCGSTKPISEIYVSPDRPNGASQCKACRDVKNGEYRKKNRDALLAYGRNRYYEIDKPRLKTDAAFRRRARSYGKKYSKSERGMAMKLLQRRIPGNHTKHLIWSRIKKSMIKNANRPSADLFLGCSTTEFRRHIESTFQTGMSWNNYGRGIGKWSVDHIAPCCVFNFEVDFDIFTCFNWRNTRALWHSDNSSKGGQFGTADEAMFLYKLRYDVLADPIVCANMAVARKKPPV